MHNIIEDFKKICKHETVYTNDEILKDEYIDYIKKNDDILFVINCEYDKAPEHCTLNYYSQYWGNKQFNELLQKHKLMYQWYDCCVAFIYNDEEADYDGCEVAI